MTENWTRENLAWLAGLLEGEGSFMLAKGRLPALRVGMTDEDVIRHAHSIAGVGQVSGPFHKRRADGGGFYKDIWVWYCGNQYHSYALMVALLPWLGERRRNQIQKAIDGWKAWVPIRKLHQANKPSIVTPEMVSRVKDVYTDGRRLGRGEHQELVAELGISSTLIYRIARGRR